MRVLVDTQVWVDHFHHAEPQLMRLLHEGEVVMHPFILGELALSNLQDRERVLKLMGDLEQIVVASPQEVLQLVRLRSLHGLGLGYVDIHLLASVLVSPGTSLWTRDYLLLRAAKDLGLQPAIQDRFFMHDEGSPYRPGKQA
ncbi:type II toxin-antitoxin system VapC family toxin [Limnobacter sp.]|uniref:type II toxin-antitoxin system VapC family toxin n=1 Tax=Limnobacter sp. TaxID=2003368 RepID=UPI0035120099